MEASVDVQTILSEATVFAASTVTMGGANKDLKKLQAMMNKLTDSVTAQAAILAPLSTKTNSGGGGVGKTPTRRKCGWA